MDEQTNQTTENKSCCYPIKCSLLGKKIIGVLVCLFIIVLIAYFFVSTQNKAKEGMYIGQELSFKNTITVSDSSEVYAKPDLAITTASVVSEGKTVASALKDNTDKMNKITDFLKAQKIEDKDLKTTSFSIYPRYEYPAPSYKRVFVGYEVTHSLLIKIRDLETVGQIIEGATNAGANEMTDLQFTIDNPEIIKNQARQEAIQKAKQKAQELASQLGVSLVRVSGFSENTGGNVPTPYYSMDKAMEIGGGGESSIAPQIQTGENKIEVSVSITYEIN